MNTLYIVTREGVYRHEICGVFYTDVMAVAEANRCATMDSDSWHAYEVRPVVLNQGADWSPRIITQEGPSEPDAIYSVKKGQQQFDVPTIRQPFVPEPSRTVFEDTDISHWTGRV